MSPRNSYFKAINSVADYLICIISDAVVEVYIYNTSSGNSAQSRETFFFTTFNLHDRQNISIVLLTALLHCMLKFINR